MKTNTIIKFVEKLVTTKKVTIEKTKVSDNSICVFVAEPYEDMGTFPYYDRKSERDADFEIVKKMIEKQNEHNAKQN